MIEIKSAFISSQEGRNDKVDLVFNKGINLIEYGQKYIFDFLSLQYQSLEEGQFFIDGKCFFPREDNNERLIILMIKSKVFVLTTCFVFQKSDKETFKEIQKQLASLRDLPLGTDEEKKNKIRRMMEIVSAFKAAYITIDQNDDVNATHEKIITHEIKQYAKDNTFLVLKSKPVEAKAIAEPKKIIEEEISIDEEDVCHIDLSSGSIKRVEEKPLTKIMKDKTLLLKVFKVNRISYLIAAVAILFSILFIAIAPHYFVTEDIFMGVFLIISCPLFLYIAYMIVLSGFDFMDNPLKNTKTRRLITLVYAEIIAFLSILLAVGAFFLLGMNNFLIDLATYHFVYSIGAIAIAVIHLAIPFFAEPLRKFNKLIKNLLKKNTK
jgi:hypothetical protein